MDTITLARELGRAIQQEESYINLKNVQAQADADAELQKLIGEFNTKRMGINEEASKKDQRGSLKEGQRSAEADHPQQRDARGLLKDHVKREHDRLQRGKGSV